MAEPRLRFAWLMLALALLVGCASRLPLPSEQPRLPLPMQLHIQAQGVDGNQDFLLVIQQEGQALRWTLLTPIGMPVARQLLADGEWRADGLLPPNPQARELFAALLFALTPADQLSHLYAGQPWSQDVGMRQWSGPRRWQVHYQQDGRFRLDLGDALTYGVAPLENGARPQ